MEGVIYGFIFGIISGCGIGGGSVLVPLLVLFMGVEQPMAQGVCLIAFLPSALSALGIHIKNKNVDFKTGKIYILPGIIFAAIGSFAMRFISAGVLRRVFGIFLVVFAIYQAVSINKRINEEKRQEQKGALDIEKSGK